MPARGFAKDLAQNHPSRRASGWRAPAASNGLTDASASPAPLSLPIASPSVKQNCFRMKMKGSSAPPARSRHSCAAPTGPLQSPRQISPSVTGAQSLPLGDQQSVCKRGLPLGNALQEPRLTRTRAREFARALHQANVAFDAFNPGLGQARTRLDKQDPVTLGAVDAIGQRTALHQRAARLLRHLGCMVAGCLVMHQHITQKPVDSAGHKRASVRASPSSLFLVSMITVSIADRLAEEGKKSESQHF